MIGNHQIKAAVRKGHLMTVKTEEGKAGIFQSDISPGISKHPFRDIRKSDLDLLGNLAAVFRPESAVAASQFQNVHVGRDTAILVDPGKPSLSIAGKIPMKLDSCGDIGSIQILGF